MPNARVSTLVSLLVTLLAIAGAPAAAPAQTGADDAGTFRVTLGGHPVGTEVFSIRQSGVGSSAQIVATARVNLTLPSGTLTLAPRLRASGIGAEPVAYQIDVGGDSPSRIVGEVGRGRFSARIVSASGEQMREYVASAGATILDDGIAHHYYFIASRVRNGRIPILIPRENRQVMAAVTSVGEESVEIEGTALTLFHLVVRPVGGEERHVWVDDLSRVIRVEIPSQGYVAVRTEIPR